MTRRPRLVVLRALGLGDLCTGVPALRALAAGFPDHERLLAAPEWQTPLAVQCGIDRVVQAHELTPLADSLEGADVAVDLHGCGPESMRLLLDRHPRRLISFRHPAVPESGNGPEWVSGEHEVARWCRLVAHFGLAADPTDLRLRCDRRRRPADVDDCVLVHPGAAAQGRRWPVDRFGAVVAALLAAGHDVVLTGSTNEVALCGELVSLVNASGWRFGRLIDLAGATDLEQLCATVASARAVLSNDTGVAHLATAFGVPSVTLFGPTSPSTWGPPADRRHVAIWKGRHGDPHATELDAGLEAITVDEVVHALAGVLAQQYV